MTLSKLELRTRSRKRYVDYQTSGSAFLPQRNTSQVITGAYVPVPGNATWVDRATFTLPTAAVGATNRRVVTYTGTVTLALLDGDAAARATADVFNARIAYFNEAGAQVSAGSASSFSIAAGTHQFSYTFMFVLDANIATTISTVRVQVRDSFMTTAKPMQIQYCLTCSPNLNRV